MATLKSPGWHADSDGLYLRIDGPGVRRWVFVFRRGVKRSEMGLSPAAAIFLAEARTAAERVRETLRQGIDPIAERRTVRRRLKTWRTELAKILVFGTNQSTPCLVAPDAICDVEALRVGGQPGRANFTDLTERDPSRSFWRSNCLIVREHLTVRQYAFPSRLSRHTTPNIANVGLEATAKTMICWVEPRSTI